MNLNENINRIKQVMGLITEETVEDLRKILQTKFPNANWNEKIIERQGDNIIAKGFSKTKNGNFIVTYNTADDFYFVEYIDGPNKGFKLKKYADDKKDNELVTKSAAHTKYEEKIKNFPCLSDGNDVDPGYIRETNDGKVVVGYRWGTDTTDYVVYFNLDDRTYSVRGGNLDGQQGKFSCNGKDVAWVITKSGTNKTVSGRFTASDFNKVTTSEPIVRGMRDNSAEPENGLIYLLQKKLKELNHYSGEPDGQFGPLTYQAVVAFQKTAKDAEGKPLVPDGKVGPKTIQALGLED
jgi:hypothetical protein